jgi:hypothetical protein
MEVMCRSETSAYTQRTTRRYISEDSTLHNHRCENLKSYKLQLHYWSYSPRHFSWGKQSSTLYPHTNTSEQANSGKRWMPENTDILSDWILKMDGEDEWGNSGRDSPNSWTVPSAFNTLLGLHKQQRRLKHNSLSCSTHCDWWSSRLEIPNRKNSNIELRARTVPTVSKNGRLTQANMPSWNIPFPLCLQVFVWKDDVEQTILKSWPLHSSGG